MVSLLTSLLCFDFLVFIWVFMIDKFIKSWKRQKLEIEENLKTKQDTVSLF